MVLAVEERHVEIGHGIAACAVRERFAHALFDGGNELAWNDAADDLLFEGNAGAAFAWLEAKPHIAELTMAAGLMLVARVYLGAARDRL